MFAVSSRSTKNEEEPVCHGASTGSSILISFLTARVRSDCHPSDATYAAKWNILNIEKERERRADEVVELAASSKQVLNFS